MTDLPEEVMERVRGILTDLALSMLDDVIAALTAEGYMVVKGGVDLGSEESYSVRTWVDPNGNLVWQEERGSPATHYAPLLPAPESD